MKSRKDETPITQPAYHCNWITPPPTKEDANRQINKNRIFIEISKNIFLIKIKQREKNEIIFLFFVCHFSLSTTNHLWYRCNQERRASDSCVCQVWLGRPSVQDSWHFKLIILLFHDGKKKKMKRKIQMRENKNCKTTCIMWTNVRVHICAYVCVNVSVCVHVCGSS